MYTIAPSLLGADFTMLKQQVNAIEKAGAKYLHLDVMDGAFVPNISFGMPVISSIRKVSGLIFDVHMMTKEPVRYIKDLKKQEQILFLFIRKPVHILTGQLNRLKTLV